MPVQVLLARYAMATRFELVLWGDDEVRLRAAGEEALEEIARLEAQLSYYQPTSELSGVNARAAREPVPVSATLFHLLLRVRELSAQSEGAFDITVAPLLRCWGFVGGSGQMPEPEQIEAARQLTGMQHLLLDESNYTVAFDRPGVELDLGAIGKGYAVDQAVERLRESGVRSALLHGGSSSIYALGAPPDAEEMEPIPIALRDAALSVSAPHGKWFFAKGRRYGHVIDPRSGYPAGRSLLAGVISASATDGDALSTALLTLGPEWLPELARRFPTVQAIVAAEVNGSVELQSTIHTKTTPANSEQISV
jgi:thiamine biosynthesis lipoprotein